MRTLVLIALLSVVGCEKTIHEATGPKRVEPLASPRPVPAVDGVPIA